MLAIDRVQSVFSLGLFRVVHRPRETMLEDAEECNNDLNYFRFCQGWLGRWAEGLWTKVPDSARK